MERPIRLTQQFIRTVTEVGRYGDGRGSYGLTLLVKPRADGGLSKTYAQQLRRPADRKAFSYGLGSTETRTLQQAREAAFDNYRRVRDGEDVRQPRDPALAKNVPTLREVAARWIELSRKNWKNDRTEQVVWQRLENHVKPLMAVRVDRITRTAILDALLDIPAVPTRDRVERYLRQILGHAVLREMRDSNPVDGILRAALAGQKNPPKHHDALPCSEIAPALAKADDRPGWPFVALALRFTALTACRSGEVRGARWDEFDLDARIWRIPAARMKSRREFSVPLSIPALNTLRRAEELADGSGYVFPSTLGKPMADGRLSEAMRLCGDTTVHGLRSSFRTWAAEQSIENDVAEMVLAHAVGSATVLAYKRTDYFQRRIDIMGQWAAVVEGYEAQGKAAAA